jgi:RNA polymerase sigma factor (sigma-70 family)
VPTHRQKEQRRKAYEHTQATLTHGPNSDQAKATEYVRHSDLVVTLDSVDDDELDIDPELAGQYHAKQLTDMLETALAKIPPREALILRLHFGVKDEPRNLVQIAKIMEMTPERVRQIKVHGLQLLREELQSTDALFVAEMAS